MAVGLWAPAAEYAACMACSAAMALIVLCDDEVRIIPRGLCWLLAIAGTALQGCAGGVPAIAVWLVDGRKGREEPSLGGGDVRCMMALSLATGPGAPIGSAACFAAAAIWAAIERVRGHMEAGEAFAFAPFLALWLVVGVLVAI